jgi:hypothetical protein
MANIHWSYFIGGNWTDAGFWSTDSVPTASDDVRIDIPGAFVTSDSNAWVNSIGIGAGSGLIIKDSWFSTIEGTGSGKNHGLIKVTDNSTLQIMQGTFDNAGTIWLGSAGRGNTLTIDTQVVLDGGGTIYMGAHSNGGENAIIGELDYFNPNIALYNVDNDIAGSGEIVGLDFINETNGVVEANSGTLELLTNNEPGQLFQNYGHINADDGGTLELVTYFGNQAFMNYGNIGVNSTGDTTTLEIGGDVRLKGGGALTLSDSANNFVVTDGSAATFDNIDNTIFGSGWFDDIKLKVVNGAHGGIVADNADAALGLDVGSFTNAGYMMAENGATLAVNGAVANSGTIMAYGGTVVIGGNVTGNGQAQIYSNGDLMLEGSSNQLNVSFENIPMDNGVLMVGLPGAASDGFAGTVAGLYSDGTHSDTIGLRDITFGSGVSWSFNENAGGTGGDLTVKDGYGHIADIALLGQYLAAGTTASSASSNLFQLSADHVTGSTGTLVTTSFHG